MNIDPKEAKKQPVYRAVTFLTGEIKNKFLDECSKGEKPAQIMRQALKEYYSKRENNGSY